MSWKVVDFLHEYSSHEQFHAIPIFCHMRLEFFQESLTSHYREEQTNSLINSLWDDCIPTSKELMYGLFYPNPQYPTWRRVAEGSVTLSEPQSFHWQKRVYMDNMHDCRCWWLVGNDNKHTSLVCLLMLVPGSQVAWYWDKCWCSGLRALPPFIPHL